MVTFQEARRIVLGTLESTQGIEESDIGDVDSLVSEVLERCGVETKIEGRRGIA